MIVGDKIVLVLCGLCEMCQLFCQCLLKGWVCGNLVLISFQFWIGCDFFKVIDDVQNVGYQDIGYGELVCGDEFVFLQYCFKLVKLVVQLWQDNVFGGWVLFDLVCYGQYYCGWFQCVQCGDQLLLGFDLVCRVFGYQCGVVFVQIQQDCVVFKD